MNRPDPDTPCSSHGLDGWVLHEHAVVGSTNDVASTLPPWHAVRADEQTSGRGRHDRSWVSNPGGLWLSAVIPVGGPDHGWQALPLAAGHAVCKALYGIGVRPLHIRWPNDVLVADRKLAGLLVDQFTPGRAVIGVGMNVSNDPATRDPALVGMSARLADLVPAAPALRDLAARILSSLREVIDILDRDGFDALAPSVNAWLRIGVPMRVETDLGETYGSFLGVDGAGRLRFGTPDGTVQTLAAHHVLRTRECSQFQT